MLFLQDNLVIAANCPVSDFGFDIPPLQNSGEKGDR
jgi:hypothetical protein